MLTQKHIEAIEKALSQGLKVEIVLAFDKVTGQKKPVISSVKRTKIS